MIGVWSIYPSSKSLLPRDSVVTNRVTNLSTSFMAESMTRVSSLQNYPGVQFSTVVCALAK